MKNFEEILRPFAEQFGEMAKKLHALPDEYLRTLLEATKMPTATNCWCYSLTAAAFIQPHIEMELRWRAAGKCGDPWPEDRRYIARRTREGTG